MLSATKRATLSAKRAARDENVRANWADFFTYNIIYLIIYRIIHGHFAHSRISQIHSVIYTDFQQYQVKRKSRNSAEILLSIFLHNFRSIFIHFSLFCHQKQRKFCGKVDSRISALFFFTWESNNERNVKLA